MRPGARRLALGLGVALPTVLLALGWLRSSLREREVLAREQEVRLGQSAEQIRSAVREGLEELRRREDARPFEHYGRFYTPTGVLSLGGAAALSPLAGDPDDPRVVGYFQVDPGEVVRTPYAVDPGDPLPPRGRRVVASVASPAFAPLRALSFGAPAPADDQERLAASGPLTSRINAISNALYRDLEDAQRGDPDAGQRAQQRRVPQTKRKPVSWDEIQAQQALNAPPVQAKSAAPVFQAIQQQAGPQQALQDMPEAPGPAGQVASDRPPGAPAFPADADLDYAPMAYLRVGGEIVLQRVVSHAGAGAVQGVLLDRDHLEGAWLPGVLARHAPAEGAPTLARDPAGCELTRPVSDEILPGLLLCFPPAAAAPAGSLALQLGALAGLIAAVGFAALAIARAGRRADELSAQKTAFVSAVSHELRTPLTTLRMHAELLQEGLVAPERLQVFYDDLAHESLRLSRLVENVLAVSQLEEGRRVLQLRPGDLAEQVREVVASQARHVERRGFPPVELELPEAPVPVAFDAQAVEQVVVNLLDNALKYARDARDRGVRVALELAPGRAVLRVQDRGPGIPEADRGRVFERFYRVQRDHDAHTPGTGLGLALVRDLARAHGGDCLAAARPGGGADLQVWWPLLRGGPAP